MNNFQIGDLNWHKMNGLIPAVIQNSQTAEVLMLGYMNQESLQITLDTQQVTFYSRSKQRLWRKGETSGNTMIMQSIARDCDGDSLLVQVLPAGPACHLGFATCFQPATPALLSFLANLIHLIQDRADKKDTSSYTAELLATGISRCAQKVGEEAVETVIAAVSNHRDELMNETADLLFHLLVLLQACELSFYDVLQCLQTRHTGYEKHRSPR